MELEVVNKNDLSGVLLVKTGFAVTAVLSAISAAALPIIKAVGFSLLGAASGFAWPVTLIIAGALVLTAFIAFVAYKVLSGTEEGSSELAEIEERANEWRKKEAQEHHKLMESVEPRKIAEVKMQSEETTYTVNDFEDIGPAAEFRKLLMDNQFQNHTPEEIDAIFKYIEKSESYQIMLKNKDDHNTLLWGLITSGLITYK